MMIRWKYRELRSFGSCQCGKAVVLPRQRRCLECHRAAMRVSRERQKTVTAMRLRVLEYLANNGTRCGLPAALVAVCEMAERGQDPFTKSWELPISAGAGGLRLR